MKRKGSFWQALSSQKGLTYAELLVSLFIFSIGMAGVAPFLVLIPESIPGGQRLLEINEIVKLKINAIQSLPLYRLESMVGKSFTEDLSGLKITTRIEPSQSYPDLIRISVEVSWKDLGGNTNSASYATYYNKREATPY